MTDKLVALELEHKICAEIRDMLTPIYSDPEDVRRHLSNRCRKLKRSIKRESAPHLEAEE